MTLFTFHSSALLSTSLFVRSSTFFIRAAPLFMIDEIFMMSCFHRDAQIFCVNTKFSKDSSEFAYSSSYIITTRQTIDEMK